MSVPSSALAQQEEQWNVLVTSHEGFQRDLKRLLKHHGTFRATGFRNVLRGDVPDVDQFLAAVEGELEQKPFAQPWLARVLPIRVHYDVQPETFGEETETRLRQLSAEIAGKSFHVRVERRGHKGILNTRDLELRFGEFLWTLLTTDSGRPVISFKDPDLVVAIEIVGVRAGIALISHQLCSRFAFVKID